MDNNEAAVFITALVVMPFVLMIWARANTKARREQAGPAIAQTQALHDIAQRMERRIESLEMLLDSELPGWRSRSRP